MDTTRDWTDNKNIRALVLLFLAVLTIFFITKTVKEWDGDDERVAGENTIVVEGMGEVAAVPDAATISFSVVETAKTVAEAQTKASTKSNAIVSYLRETGIEERDIRTDNYNIYPQYQFVRAGVCNQFDCPPGKQIISGYEVSQSVTIKVRDTEKAGDLLTGIGSRGATNVSNIDFVVDEVRLEELKAEARKLAVENAREKAGVIADSLGVDIDKIVGYNENMYGPVYPMYDRAVSAEGMGGANQAPSPELPPGENKVRINVSVTFEIED